MDLGSTPPLTEMSTRNLAGGKGRPARKADNFTAVRRLSRICGSLDVSQLYGPPRPVTGIALPFCYKKLHIFTNVYLIWTKIMAGYTQLYNVRCGRQVEHIGLHIIHIVMSRHL
jgi:hypothetical protein